MLASNQVARLCTMDTKFRERELKTVIPKPKLDGIRLVKSCRTLLKRECGQEFKEEVSE